MAKLTVKDLNVEGKKVLVRADYNVPMNEAGEITNASRIDGSLPTIDYLLDQGASVILFSHLGRVKKEEDKAGKSLKPVADYLKEKGYDITFVPETRGLELEEAAEHLKAGQLLLVENTRYEDIDGKKESNNDEELAKYWAGLGDFFVNDAFGTGHRAHASNVGLSTYSEQAALGLLFNKELTTIGETLENPESPFVLVLGGSKVSDKLPVINNLIDKADHILIGGGMAFTFLKAQGKEIGKSLLEEELIDDAKNLLEENGDKIVLPVDYVCAEEFSADAAYEAVAGDIPDHLMGLDIGPESVALYADYIKQARTVIWNGPMGVFEIEQFAKGTEEMARAIGENDQARSIVGGGDSVSAVESLGYADAFTHISTGGGAMLELLAGTELPGVKAIDEK